MATFDVPKNRGVNHTKTPKSEHEISASKEDGRTYGIDCLHFSTEEHDLVIDSK